MEKDSLKIDIKDLWTAIPQLHAILIKLVISATSDEKTALALSSYIHDVSNEKIKEYYSEKKDKI